VLQERGPEACCFGLYLASRIDFLPAELCRELALIPDQAAPIPTADIKRIIASELGSQWERAFTEFDDAPVESKLIAQSHRARVLSGAFVELVVLRPQYCALQSPEPAQIFDTSIISEYCGDRATAYLLDDFTATLRRKTDLRALHDGIELMARDAGSMDLLRSHRCYRELSSGKLLTVEPLYGQPLQEIPRGDLQSDNVARRMCQAWLHQSLRGHCFPVDPWPHNVLLFPGTNQMAFGNCDLVGLPTTARENLAAYFNAVLADDPDKATMYLLREMMPSRSAAIDVGRFRSSFRQAGYFGVLEPILGTNSNALAQIVFQHWKTALEHGYAPKPHLLCFYRGLFGIARIAHQLAPNSDGLREGLTELNMTSAFAQVQTIMDWRYWYQSSDKFASALLNLPRVLDEALSKAVSPRGADVRHDKAPVTHRQQRDLQLTLILISMILFQTPQTYVWSGKITLLALLLAGVLVLQQLKT
jgi:ubiquinone biosynthesis protein